MLNDKENWFISDTFIKVENESILMIMKIFLKILKLKNLKKIKNFDNDFNSIYAIDDVEIKDIFAGNVRKRKKDL